MKPFRAKLEDNLRIFSWYVDHGLFKIISLFKNKKIPQEVNKIIIVEFKYIGDIVVLTPAIKALKEKFNSAKIDIIIPEGMKGLLENNPNINKIIELNPLNYNSDELSQRLLKEKYDLGILFHSGSYKLSKVLKDAGVKFRIGCTRQGVTEGKGFFLNNKTKPTFKWKHKVEDNLDVIKNLGINAIQKKTELFVDLILKNKINSSLAKGPNKVVLIHPIPQHKSHEWVPERFSELIKELVRLNYKVAISGSKKDNTKVNNILNRLDKITKKQVINFSGKLNLKGLIALASCADYVISVDTGTMHIAAALDKPVISLFGAGNPKIWHPYTEKQISIFKDKEVCTSCMKHKCFRKGKRNMECMKAITIQDILSAFERIKSLT
ncbi:glycosyltransferase family 9 protein [Candidatus Woesearchaeota archaeon]|nr:glycosyltransferase family 9 protein [Candidatus Woesearchaeota archaeon]